MIIDLSTMVVIVIVLFGLTAVYFGINIVEQGWEYTVERFGRYTRTLKPGLNIIIPYIDTIRHKVNMMEQVLDVERQEVISKDNATLSVDGVCFFQILSASDAMYNVDNFKAGIENLVITNLRTAMGALDVDQVLSERDQINQRLLAVVDNATDQWGIKVTRVEIKDIRLPEDISRAMSKQLTAEREKRARILEAEGKKQAAILEAEGLREASYREAESRERLAKAEANATQMVSNSIANGDVRAVNFFVAQEYVKALRDIASAENGKTVFMPLDASGIMGAIGGIQELFKSAPSGSTPPSIIQPPAPITDQDGESNKSDSERENNENSEGTAASPTPPNNNTP